MVGLDSCIRGDLNLMIAFRGYFNDDIDVGIVMRL